MKTKLSIITAILLLGATAITADDYAMDENGISEEMQEQMVQDSEADEALAAKETQASLQNKEDRNAGVLQESESSTIIADGLEGVSNTYYGRNAGNGTNNGFANAAFGYSAGDKIIGNHNVFFGDTSGASNTTGGDNVFVGYLSGKQNKTSNSNVYIGSSSGYTNDTSNGENTFVGHYSGYKNRGSINSFFGYWAGRDNTSGGANLIMGGYAGRYNTTGSYNVFLGPSSGYKNKTGSDNVFIGGGSGYDETGSNKLYIDNSASSKPLIWGDFNTNVLNVNGSLAVNTKTPAEMVDINGVDNAARFQLTSITATGNEAAQFIQRRAQSDGSGNEEAVENGDNIGLFSFRGWNGSGFTGSKAVIAVAATEDWDGSSNGNQISFRHTPNGSSSMVTALQVKGNADVYIPNGNLYVKGSKMNVPDYVFKEDYQLMPLDELKAYVQKNNHLPGIASADEVDKAGLINLSGLQMTLLEKVEELTLYTLQQEEALAAKDVEMKSVQVELKAKDSRISTMEAKQKAQDEKIAKLESILTNLALDTSNTDKTKVSANLK